MASTFCLKKNLANILTLSNFTLGIISLLLSSSVATIRVSELTSLDVKRYAYACALIILAGFMDRFDGKVARRMQTVSDLGKQLDSLSDLVSFGVAPGILVWKVYLTMAPMASGFRFLPILIYAAALFFPLAGALRLAKFNIQEDPSYFIGIPITLAGSLTALLTLMFLLSDCVLEARAFTALLLVLLIIFLGVLMISPFKIKKR